MYESTKPKNRMHIRNFGKHRDEDGHRKENKVRKV